MMDKEQTLPGSEANQFTTATFSAIGYGLMVEAASQVHFVQQITQSSEELPFGSKVFCGVSVLLGLAGGFLALKAGYNIFIKTDTYSQAGRRKDGSWDPNNGAAIPIENPVEAGNEPQVVEKAHQNSRRHNTTNNSSF